MKIKKILLYNFKNFKDKKIINFSDDINFLVGPNGFGKTSIFDALELGITGNLSRVKSKDKITPENISYNKPFFQNDKNKQVVIKLWLEKDTGDSLVIVRIFEDDVYSRKKKNAPQKSIEQFQLYKETDTSNFEEVDNLKLPNMSQSDIDRFLEFNGDYHIEKVFDLFNYIQQEETTFFLKQNEKERSDSLSFLLKTDEIENKIKKMKDISNGIKNSIASLSETRDTLINSLVKKVPYERIFEHKEFDFDKVTPFNADDISHLADFKQNLQDIIKFKQKFSPSEYRKKNNRDRILNNIENNQEKVDSLYYSIMSPLFQNMTWTWEKFTLENPWLLEYTLLENFISSYDEVKNVFHYRNQLINYSNTLSLNIDEITERNFSYDLRNSFSEDFENIKSHLNEYTRLKGLANQVDKSLSELARLRGSLGSTFKELSDHKHVADNTCPFCSNEFDSFKQLKESYDNYQDYLTNISSQNSQQLQNAQNQVIFFKTQSLEKIKNELTSITINIDQNLLNRIDELIDLVNRKDLQSQTVKGFNNFIRKYINIEPFELRDLSFNDFIQQVERCNLEFSNKLPVKEDVYEWIQKVNTDSTRIEYEKLPIEYPDFNFRKFQVLLNSKITREKINQLLTDLRANLSRYIKINNPINENLLVDPKNIFQVFFDNDIKIFDSINISQLENKKYYLDFQVSIINDRQSQIISDKIIILKKSKKYLDEIKKIYEKEVNDYKINIIKLLRIPFFVYSAKILQNYQQGLGVFLTYREATENSEEKAVIKFKTDTHNDHDAMYQLSTGQLAVVSLAFTLSLNTMFKLSHQLNFLMIDDPIQDMDSMNVLSFVEILRHSIIDKYQIILSTYSDSNALFMGYKFANTKDNIEVNYQNVKEL